MPELLADPERNAIEDLEHEFEDAKVRVVEELNRIGDLEAMDSEFMKRFRETVSRLARLVNQSLPLSFPPEASDEIRRTVIETMTEAEEVDEARPLEAADDLLIRLERVRHVLRDALDESLGVQDDDARQLGERLTSWLTGVPKREIAELVGVSTRTFQRFLQQGGPASNRMQLVARLVVILYRAWTPNGVLAWFRRPRPELDNSAPLDVLDNAEYEGALMTAVRRGRAGHGS